MPFGTILGVMGSHKKCTVINFVARQMWIYAIMQAQKETFRVQGLLTLQYGGQISPLLILLGTMKIQFFGYIILFTKSRKS